MRQNIPKTQILAMICAWRGCTETFEVADAARLGMNPEPPREALRARR
jgi:hypothetical protein